MIMIKDLQIHFPVSLSPQQKTTMIHPIGCEEKEGDIDLFNHLCDELLELLWCVV